MMGGSTMKAACKLLAGLAVVFTLVVVAQAQDKKEKTVTGKLVCGKCTLNETGKCSNVLQVKEGDKTVNYFLDDKGKGETYHKGVCAPNSEKEATVTGTVTTKDGKKHIKASKVDVK
jgi:hypothetical protein